MACERLGRVCYGMDVGPRSVDICLRRWEAETGQQATRVAQYAPLSAEEEDEEWWFFRAAWDELRHRDEA